jgi:hypothetical protein
MAPLPGTEGELKRDKILNDTTWMVYCCCEGWGFGPMSGGPLVAAEAKQLCIRSSVSTTGIMDDDGLCSQVQVLLCITQQCQLPPLEGAPVCACFGKKFGGSIGSTKWKGDLFEQSAIMDNTFWIMYFLCEGWGINKMDQGLFGNQFKELCCRGSTNIEPPVVDGVFCGSVAKELCIYSECQMPPAQGNPQIACCTWRLKKKGASGPAQVEMK